MYNLISACGILALLLLAWAVSPDRRQINGRVIAWGVGLQLLFAGVIFLVPASRPVFSSINDAAVAFIDAGQKGVVFLFGRLAYPPGTEGPEGESLGFFFFAQVLPVIIFFAAFVQLLYYLGVMQRIIRLFARVLTRVMRISGAEGLCAASNIFVGVEAATAIRPYLQKMTRSELCLVLTAGMATVASSVLAAYVGMLHRVFPEIAGHLIAATIMSVPAAIVMAKLVMPETQTPETLGKNVPLAYERDPTAIDAVINGAMAGGRMIVSIAVLLVAFLGLVGVANLLLGTIGGWVHGGLGWKEAEWSLQNLFGWMFRPFAVLMGVPPADAGVVGKLLGERLIVTEAVAYPHLANAMEEAIFTSPRSSVIAAYALCGFAHVASLAIFIGGVAGLVPERRADLSRVGPRALLAATLACLMTGAVAGLFYHEGMENLLTH
ncbi:MAG: NupC/NupG family nucleoside CNT transporter [Opitutales bacterium]